MRPWVSKSVRLTPAFFQILLSVANEPQHGYAIMLAVRDRTEGRVKLGPGSLYWAINRLVDAGLLDEVDPPPGQEGQRRRFYRLSKNGRKVLNREVQVLADIVRYAESQHILRGPGSR